jgi:branched-chain amino acid transport system permease protein
MKLALLVLAFVAAIAFTETANSYYVFIMATLALTAVAGIGLNVLLGLTGQVSFGHVGFYALGAYAVAVLTVAANWSFWQALPVAALLAGATGALLALPALRVRGPYFGLTTLVAVLMLQNFVVVDASLTGGEIGLTVPDVITISDTKNYLIALWFMAISGAILFALSRSPVGLILQASGQDAVQAGALGFNVVKHKLTAFIISAFFSGLAGALLVFYLGSASVGTFIDITVGVQIIIAAVIGGRRTILGAVLGAIFIIAMSEALRPVGDLANFIVFAMALVVVLLFPNGFFGLLTRSKETS